MKRIYITLFFTVAFTYFNYAQIEVYSNNNVGVGTASTVNSKLSVNSTGHTSWAGYIYNGDQSSLTGGLFVSKASPSSSVYGVGIQGVITSGLGYTIGIQGQSNNATASSNGKAYGVLGKAGNATNGYNYGVYGVLEGTNNGAGVFGTTTGDYVVDDKYAGYFYGKVKVNGQLWTTYGQVTTSDERLKKEIKELDNNNLAKLKKVKAVRYKYKTPIEQGTLRKETTDTLSADALKYMDVTENVEHIGLIAQEVQAIYPELVKTDKNGNLGIIYDGLIPVLLEAIKEQQIAIEALTTEVEKLKVKKVKE